MTKPDGTEGQRLRVLIERVRDLHANEGGRCAECLDAYGEYAEWPCRTVQELNQVDAEVVKDELERLRAMEERARDVVSEPAEFRPAGVNAARYILGEGRP